MDGAVGMSSHSSVVTWTTRRGTRRTSDEQKRIPTSWSQKLAENRRLIYGDQLEDDILKSARLKSNWR